MHIVRVQPALLLYFQNSRQIKHMASNFIQIGYVFRRLHTAGLVLETFYIVNVKITLISKV